MDDYESFYNIFLYNHMMHDAIDYGLTYEIVTIQKDIETAGGFKLKAGAKYETCYFLFNKEEFKFINWKEREDQSGYLDPDETSVIIPQKELAPFLKW